MTNPVDKFAERIAAARALPEAEGMKGYAEHLAGYDPPFSLAEIADRLRGRKARLAGERAAREATTPHAGGKQGRSPAAPTAAVLAFYSAGDAQETAFLCRIAKAPELAANFIAARTPIVKVREALTQRANQVLAQRAKEAIALIARKKAVAAQWDEAAAKVNAESAGSKQ